MREFILIAIWTSGWLCGIIWTQGQQLQIDKLKESNSKTWHRIDEEISILKLDLEPRIDLLSDIHREKVK